MPFPWGEVARCETVTERVVIIMRPLRRVPRKLSHRESLFYYYCGLLVSVGVYDYLLD